MGTFPLSVLSPKLSFVDKKQGRRNIRQPYLPSLSEAIGTLSVPPQRQIDLPPPLFRLYPKSN